MTEKMIYERVLNADFTCPLCRVVHALGERTALCEKCKKTKVCERIKPRMCEYCMFTEHKDEALHPRKE